MLKLPLLRRRITYTSPSVARFRLALQADMELRSEHTLCILSMTAVVSLGLLVGMPIANSFELPMQIAGIKIEPEPDSLLLIN